MKHYDNSFDFEKYMKDIKSINEDYISSAEAKMSLINKLQKSGTIDEDASEYWFFDVFRLFIIKELIKFYSRNGGALKKEEVCRKSTVRSYEERRNPTNTTKTVQIRKGTKNKSDQCQSRQPQKARLQQPS